MLMLRDEELQEIVAFFHKCILSEKANKYLNRLIAALRALRAENAGLKAALKLCTDRLAEAFDAPCTDYDAMETCPRSIKTTPDTSCPHTQESDDIDLKRCWYDYMIAKAQRETESAGEGK